MLKHSRYLSLPLILTAMGIASNAMAGAYQLTREYNAVEIGNSGAGGAAIATDASTAYANPAGLVNIHNNQLVASGDAVFTYSKFTGSNTWSTTSGLPIPPYTRTGTAKSNDKILVPAFFFAMPLSTYGLAKWSTAFSVTVPYGLSTSYNNDSVIRYSATISKLNVIDISPSIAYKFNEQWSLGAGVDIDRTGVDIRREVGVPSLSTALDSSSKNTAAAWGYGGHAGLLFQLTPKSRVGLAYHTSVNTGLTGTSTLSGPLAPGGERSSANLRTKFILPPLTVLSMHHEFNTPWGIDASAYYTQWNNISGTLTAYNLAGLTAAPVTTSIAQHYRNTWLLALGGSYQFSPAWLMRAGVSYDQSPVKSKERNVIIPDSDRVGLSVGAHYQVDKHIGLDGGWMHLFFHDSSVSVPLSVATQTSVSTGSYNSNHVDILGLQATIDFV